tara:strand:- start:383 stop:775 length:393 start_codon:yes stop_codon:yes gene_type:complete
MAKKKIVDAESAIEDMKNKKFGLSIQNIIALVTVLSTGIAGWYSFTGRIDGLEEIVTGFAEASDIELVTTKLDKYDEDFKYLREKVDGMKAPKVKSYDGDIIKLKNEIDKLKGEIAKLEKLLKDPLSDLR